MRKRAIKILLLSGLIAMATSPIGAVETPKAYDIDMAKELCDELPLEDVEGVWLYPDDKVTVMILRNNNEDLNHGYATYNISVVETSDAQLHPGDVIGKLTATPEDKTFKIELATEKKSDNLFKSRTCIAKLSSDGDSFTFKKQKAPFKGRFNFNFSRLLPGFWKVVSTGFSPVPGTPNLQPAVGMIKVYPSYDGNGSSRRKVRYL